MKHPTATCGDRVNRRRNNTTRADHRERLTGLSRQLHQPRTDTELLRATASDHIAHRALDPLLERWTEVVGYHEGEENGAPRSSTARPPAMASEPNRRIHVQVGA